LLQYWEQTGHMLLDTDDAMRLTQMRAWPVGHGWYDLHEPRLQGYDSHWSRLIDAGLAGLYLLLRHGVDPGPADRLMRAFWPPLWLLPTMAGMVAIAWRIGSRAGRSPTGLPVAGMQPFLVTGFAVLSRLWMGSEAVKSLRRKASLLYEPRRRSRGFERLFWGSGMGASWARPACREREDAPWARSLASTSAPPIPASQLWKARRPA
jgi:hypothetical protein